MTLSTADQPDYFQQNLSLLQEYHPAAWQVVTSYQGEPPGKIVAAADGFPNLVMAGPDNAEVFFHGQQDINEEKASYYALVPEGATGVVAFVGMGLGYTPPAMLADRPALRHIMIFEPETAIFIQALRHRDLAGLLADSRVSIALGPEADVSAMMAPLVRALQLESFHVLKHNPCFRVFPEVYREMHDKVFAIGNSFNLSGNTTVTYGSKFIDNRLRHLTAIPHQCLFEHLKNLFAGVPAILVSGGPSLDKNIHLLPRAKGKAVIIAVDTVLPALLAHGVVPDFTGCIDMQDIVLEKVLGVADRPVDTALVCSSWVNTLVPKIFPARQVHWTFTAKNMEKWLNGIFGGQVLTSGAGTVAQLNFTAAALLGCSPIIFVGQDLAFAGTKSHAAHTSLSMLPARVKAITEGRDKVTVAAYGGGQVVTSRTFLGFKHTFEQSMATLPDRHFINATEGGVRLEGAEELSLQEVLDRYCQEEREVGATIRAAEEQPKMPGRLRLIDELGKTVKLIGRVEKDLAVVDHLVARLGPELADLRERDPGCRRFDMLPPALKKGLGEMDKVNKSLDKARVWGLLDEATMEGLRLSDRLNHELGQLAADPARYLEWLAKSVERFKLINHFRRQVLEPFANRLREVHGRLHREHFLLGQAGKKKAAKSEDAVLELLRLYRAGGDLVILERLLAEFYPGAGQSAEPAEVTFFRGVLSANRCLFSEMEQHFATALAADPELADQVAECRRQLAERYLGFGKMGNPQSLPSWILRSLFKALRFSSESPQLRQSLAAAATALLKRIAKAIAAEAEVPVAELPADMVEQAALWSRELADNPALAPIIPVPQSAELHRHHASFLLAAEKFAEAVPVLQAAVALAPEDPQLHLLLADAALAAGDFPTGVSALDQAVALDRTCAHNWETIGDTLLAADQAEDALAAYEKCFTALPQAVEVLKKIGDCYQALNQPEAAYEAYQQLAQRLSGSETESV